MSDVTVHFPINPLQPGGYSAIDASALIDANTRQGAPVAAVLGACAGGTPNKAQYFTDPQALRSVLRSGAAYDCARLALAGGASRVCVIRAGATITQATKALAGSAGTCVTLTSKDYGAWTTNIKVTVEANNKVTITYVDPNGITYTEIFNVGAGATAATVAAQINGQVPGVNASAYVTATAGAGTMPLATAAIAALTGGSDGSALDASAWTVALAAIETEDVSIVVAATGDATVHAQVKTHCDNMSTTQARKERTQCFGAVLGESVAAQVTRAGNLRSARSQLVYPGFTFPNDQGVATAYDPFYHAAFVAGEHCGLPDPATSLTHKREDGVLDIEVRLSTIFGGDVDTLLAAGVTPIVPAPRGGVWIVDSLATYVADNSFRDFHKIRTADESARRLRTRLEDRFTGGKVLAGTPSEIQHEALSELNDQLTQELISDFHTPTTKRSGANGTQVTAPIQLVETEKYILITVALQPPGA